MGGYVITGGRSLSGEIAVSGAKNALLPILAASILNDKEIVIHDCPDISDAENMIEILRTLGCSVKREGNTLVIDASNANAYTMPPNISKKIRSSIFMLGSVLGRFKRARFTYPGGCEIGNRPIDLHLDGLKKLNVRIKEEYGYIDCWGDDMRGASIHLDYPSVGATENIMMAAVAARGDSVIQNAAREPEIEDLERFLNELGFSVSGAGTSTVCIKGGGVTRRAEHTVIPDRIVAGTLLCAAAATRGDVLVTNVDTGHISLTLSKLNEMGCDISARRDTVRLKAPERLRRIKLLETLPYPGFPTDMQAQMFALCSIADGTSVIVEIVFDNRFKHAAELKRMGADITLKDRTAVISGVERLMGATMFAHDLRGGAALVIAGLCADGRSVVYGSEYVDRGYERFENMLGALGADIDKFEA